MDHDSGETAKTRSGQAAMQMADGRVVKLRPSSRRGYAAGKGGRSERLDALQPSLGKVEAQTHSGLCGTSLLGDRWESLARSL